MRKLMAMTAIAALAGQSVAGDCFGGGLFARRAERRVARSASCQSCQSSESTFSEVQPAEIKTTSTYKTTKLAEKVTITPTGPKSAVQPK